jgi:hypothetical protein
MDSMMQEIAADLIDKSSLRCEYHLPELPQGQQYDYSTFDLFYAPGDNSAPHSLVRVDHENLCTPGAFTIDEQSLKITLCPQTCDVVEADSGASVYLSICPGWSEY